jgi:RimJ/RimL family protein N-acetyltransferase
MAVEGEHTYPMKLRVSGKDLVFRFMSRDDGPRIVALARSLSDEDRMFLARDITQAANVEGWFEDKNIKTIIAIDGDEIAGYAAVHRSQMRWSDHVAELRVMVAPDFRGKGLGRVLTQEAFAYALARGVEKMVAQMTLDQKAAIAVFEGLGFRPEALLRDHVKDRNGEKHDLLMLSHEVARFEANRVAFGVAEAFGM